MTARIESHRHAYCVEGDHEVLKRSKGSRQVMDPLMLSCDECGCDCCEEHWESHECWGCVDCGEPVTYVPETGDRCDDCHELHEKAQAREQAIADYEEAGDRKRQEQKEEAA